ncbi:hypothetical protein C1H46_008202 [Malus baccata]|uniref:Uncharacterized protein n=1 Tax=Malus baccata TaxID=106549 RepID=A0A540N505_MALBA|nr:hypothetical protein C1H46_008202 [Malus baccata]
MKHAEMNASRAPHRPYYLQNGNTSGQKSGGTIASPAKSLVPKVMDLMFEQNNHHVPSCAYQTYTEHPFRPVPSAYQTLPKVSKSEAALEELESLHKESFPDRKLASTQISICRTVGSGK